MYMALLGLAIMVASTLGLFRMYGLKLGALYIRRGVLCIATLTAGQIAFSLLLPHWPNLAFFASCLGLSAYLLYVGWTVQLVGRILRGKEPK